MITQWRLRRNSPIAKPSQAVAAVPSAGQTVTINELILAYVTFATSYCVKDGQPTKELVEMKAALRRVRKLFGSRPIYEIGPTALKTVRKFMIDEQQLCRNVVNHRCERIKRFVR